MSKREEKAMDAWAVYEYREHPIGGGIMTANEFVRRIQDKVSMLSTGDIPIKLNGKDIECVIELIENGKGYYMNIKQPTKDLALTAEDVRKLIEIWMNLPDFHATSLSQIAEETLDIFNEQRKQI